MAKIEFKTQRYYGSEKNIHTVSWDPSEIDGRDISKWCIQNFGPAGYNEEIEGTRWLAYDAICEVILCKDEDLTLFLLRWQ